MDNGKAPMKRALWLVVALALLATRSPAYATDLKVIRCSLSPQEDAKMGSALQHLDDKLADLSAKNDLYEDTRRRFIRACRALKGDMNQDGPLMDAMIGAANALDWGRQRLKTLYQDLQKEPEADIFSRTSVRMIVEFRRRECTDNILRNLVDKLNRAQRLLESSDINCASPPAE